VFPDVTRTDICDQSYVRGIKQPRFNDKVAALANYGVSIHDREFFQVDHLIPLSLGGTNEMKNLWPQQYAGSRGAAAKDQLEGQLRGLVCSGTLTLKAAQRAIAGNWWTAYDRYMGLPIDPGAAGFESGTAGNAVNSAGGTLTNSGTWTLSAHNIYSGNTTIGGGTLALAGAGSINNSPTIDVQSGAVFDVSAVSGGYALGASQNLRGIGSVVGNVTANGSVTPGETGIGTLTFSSSLVLAGTTTMEINRDTAPNTDLLAANSLTYGGSLVVNNIGSNPQAGDIFDLFDWTTRSGSFSSITLPALDPGLSWDTSNLSVNGTISVSSGSGINTGRTNLTFFVSGSTLDISWPADHTGWRLQSQTNPVTVGLRSNWFDVPGSTLVNSVTNPINPANGSVFYRMVYP
jgi:autotransporter-associated beta strand protein